ncbi:MAG: hypothetical protein ACI8P0_002894 [Planctomycetaceae bacterium]|jgi:hypothetical protein
MNAAAENLVVEEVEVSGHIIDSLILPKILDSRTSASVVQIRHYGPA